VANGSVCLTYITGTKQSTSWHESYTDQLGALLATPQILAGGKLAVRYGTGGIVEARNKAVAQFLESDTEWLWWIDTDMGFEPNTVQRLLAAAHPTERPIVGGLCFAMKETQRDGYGGYRTEPRPTIFDWVENADGQSGFTGRADYPINELTRCGATGSACLLIHRSVFEKIGSNWYDQMHNPSTNQVMGEDMSFCARAAIAGFPIYVHTGIRTTHHKEVWLGEQDYWNWRQVPPATEHVAVIVPVLNRPQNVKPFIDSLRASTGLANAYFVCEEGDTEERQELAQSTLDCDETIVAPTAHTFAEKINYAVKRQKLLGCYKWIFIVGDDVRFRPGWLDHALHVARVSGANVIGTNDLGNPSVTSGAHATHMLINTDYIAEQGASWDGPGIVCHEGYSHNFVDNEIVMAAKQRGTFAMALGSIVEHLHPAWGKAPPDETYLHGNREFKQDQQLFKQRATRHAAT
jgi:hypothetical protein